MVETEKDQEGHIRKLLNLDRLKRMRINSTASNSAEKLSLKDILKLSQQDIEDSVFITLDKNVLVSQNQLNQKMFNYVQIKRKKLKRNR